MKESAKTMSQIFMITIPRLNTHRREIMEFIKNNDIHKWIVAKETGRSGYEHWQIRLSTNRSFEDLKGVFPTAHIEPSTEWGDYERKEANFVCDQDTNDVLRCRFGKLRENQRRILREVYRSSDRSIVTVYDPCGGTGKSFLCRWLYERNLGFYVPPTVRNTQGIIQYVASGYRGQRIIVIDIPRSSRWTNELYEGIETIKDGLVYDTRYSAKMRDIWGVKVLCLTNTQPCLDSLSLDRWILITSDGVRISTTSYAGKNQQKKDAAKSASSKQN